MPTEECFVCNKSNTLLRFFCVKLKHQPYSHAYFGEAFVFHILIYQ